ncbi:NUDIX domain-containing protein [Lutibacter sp. TH_r2]|uniref:NUDIX hydrolase n=1 Tax=Lutibacter sp. TH_r2 TaxID=3082083 RepID=UPI0029546122|nr:NUDIX domain-containing protein [Lutibacter sp. TH_r2]MDV7187639.1 NUDIX domain-containing protein [Lutibacter sp. TH_r2]
MKLIDNSHIYNTQQHILVAVDCVIFGFINNKLKLLLFRRKLEPARGDWSLIGAFIKNDLSTDDAAKQVLLETTGLNNIYLEQLKTYGAVYRDPAERVISVVYYSLTSVTEFELESVEKYDAHWFDLNEIPELIFDHREMVEDAIERLRNKAKHQPIGFNLLPEYFTIPELQSLYECIYQQKLDARNFRKKILSFDILTKTTKKDKSGSKKGAFLYTFDEYKFQKLNAEGGNFEI